MPPEPSYPVNERPNSSKIDSGRERQENPINQGLALQLFAMTGPTRTTDESPDGRVLDHLLQLDHWTFLLAFGLVAVNIVVNSRVLSAVAGSLLLVALCYDLYEFYADR